MMITYNIVSSHVVLSLPLGDLGQLREGDYSLFFYDADGKKARKNRFSSETFTLYKEGLSEGLFFFMIKNNEKVIGSGKLIILK